MGNFCQNCGNKMMPKDKFCTKCGTPIVKSEQTNSVKSENVQETVDNLKETMGNVSAAVKEKAKQAVQQSQEFVQSEQFQKAKAETVKSTKNILRKIFECNINNDAEYVQAEKRRKQCLYIIFITIAAAIFLFPFYDEFWWFDGIMDSIMSTIDRISLLSRIVAIPICVIFGIRYFFVAKASKSYRAENPEAVSPVAPIKKSVILAVLAACIISVPVVNKIDDVSWNHYKTAISSTSNSSYSSGSESTSYSSDSGSGSYAEEKKYLKDDDFILDYVNKITFGGYDFKIEATDRYNRYIISGTAQKEYSHLTEQLIVYLVWIDENYNVDGKQKTATNINQKSRLVSEMRDLEIWDSELFL